MEDHKVSYRRDLHHRLAFLLRAPLLYLLDLGLRQDYRLGSSSRDMGGDVEMGD